jgi:hypothetical protein
MKLCPQSLCDMASIGFLVEEKPDDHSLSIFHPNSDLDVF